MKSLWNEREAVPFQADPLALRVYTSRLLGREPDLVLHGGGNTSVKAEAVNRFGEKEEILYVKGSGWDLAAIEAAGFALVRLKVLKQMAALEQLSDPEMVKLQRSAMIDPYAPNPSVEAILHAILPFQYVDHTHADAVVTITNTDQGEKKIREIYGSRVVIVPYVMPGFILAKKVFEMTRGLDWKGIEGMILMNHGIFTFHDEAKASYEAMIRLVNKAEAYLQRKGAAAAVSSATPRENLLELAQLRQAVSKASWGLTPRGQTPLIARLDSGPEAVSFSNLPNAASIVARGPITPDHVIRTKRIPVVIGKDPVQDVEAFRKEYEKYFQRNTDGRLTMLDPAPRWAVWPGHGTVSFGPTLEDAEIALDIVKHTVRAIQWGEALGGWKPLSEKEIFEVEYWSLEQAKLKKAQKTLLLQGKIAVVTGAASGIGHACVEALSAQGAVVAALDIDSRISSLFESPAVLGKVCDVTNPAQIQASIEETVRRFGGLDILISNAGNFAAGREIAKMDPETWQKSLDLNLTSHQRLLQACIPYLSLGVDPAVVVIGSKNVPAPGPGASAYSVAKAGLTQLARVAALELAPLGIRVNVIHPNQVFDTAIWTPEVLESRAEQYGMSVEEYKTSNLLKVQITSKDVAELACAMAGPLFSKTTGAQVPIDGGSDRVI